VAQPQDATLFGLVWVQVGLVLFGLVSTKSLLDQASKSCSSLFFSTLNPRPSTPPTPHQPPPHQPELVHTKELLHIVGHPNLLQVDRHQIDVCQELIRGVFRTVQDCLQQSGDGSFQADALGLCVGWIWGGVRLA